MARTENIFQACGLIELGKAARAVRTFYTSTESHGMTDIESEIAQIAGRDPRTQQTPAVTSAITFPDLRQIETHATALLVYKRHLRETLERMEAEAKDLTTALRGALGQLTGD